MNPELQRCPACLTKKDAGKFVCAVCGGSGYVPATHNEPASQRSRPAKIDLQTIQRSGRRVFWGVVIGTVVGAICTGGVVIYDIARDLEACAPDCGAGAGNHLVVVLPISLLGAIVGAVAGYIVALRR